MDQERYAVIAYLAAYDISELAGQRNACPLKRVAS
jgi:hypothetical protein